MPERGSHRGRRAGSTSPRPTSTRAKRFYGELFGWTTMSPGTPEETGGYKMFLSGGQAGGGRRADDAGGPAADRGRPTSRPTTSTRSPRACAEAGGSALFEPMDVMDAGRMGFFAHPAGGAFGAWQAGTHTGAELVNEPVSLAWNTLITPRPEGAARVLRGGLRAARRDAGLRRRADYTILHARRPRRRGHDGPAAGDARRACRRSGASRSRSRTPTRRVAKAQELGGEVRLEPMDMQGVGRIAGAHRPLGRGVQRRLAERLRGAARERGHGCHAPPPRR